MCLDDTKQAFVTQLAIKKVGLVDASPHILHFWCKGAEPQKAAMLFFPYRALSVKRAPTRTLINYDHFGPVCS